MTFILDPSSRRILKHIKSVDESSRKAIRLGLIEVGKDLKKEAVRSIKEPPKTGRLYRLRRKGVLVTHQASAPGQPPANFTGLLKSSISRKMHGFSELRFVARADKAPYVSSLEFGFNFTKNRKILPRPYMKPAIDRSDKYFNERLGTFLVKHLTVKSV